MLLDLAQGDVSKMDEKADMPLKVVLTYLTYKYQKTQLENHKNKTKK